MSALIVCNGSPCNMAPPKNFRSSFFAGQVWRIHPFDLVPYSARNLLIFPTRTGPFEDAGCFMFMREKLLIQIGG